MSSSQNHRFVRNLLTKLYSLFLSLAREGQTRSGQTTLHASSGSGASDHASRRLGITLVLVLLIVVLLPLRRPHKLTAGFNLPVASDTCACYPNISQIIVLRVTREGDLILGPDKVPRDQLTGRLREIYRDRAERKLYFFPDQKAPFRRVADIVDVVQHVKSEQSQALAVPRELQSPPENMNIQLKLVTPQAISSPCPQNCFNWVVEGIPVLPGFSTRGQAPD